MGFEFGLYVERKSFLHSLDPRSKLVMVIVSIFYPAFFNNPLFTGAYFFFLITLCALGKIGLKRFLLIIYASAVFLIASLILWPAYVTEGTPFIEIRFPWGWVYRAPDLGVLYALNNMFRIVIPVVAMILYVSVTKPYYIVQMFDKMKLSYKIGMAFTIALRYIPVMFYETVQIIEAQSARGQELKRGSLIKKIRNFIPIFIPLLVRMLRITVVTSMSLEARAFGASKKRTYIDEIRFTRKDIIFTIIMLAILATAITIRFLGIGRLPIPYA